MMVLAEFIGGPWDGQRRALAEAPLQLQVVVPPVSWLGDRPPEPLGVAPALVYRLMGRRLGSPLSSPVRYVLERAAR